MKKFSILVLVIAFLCSVAVLVLSVWPGVVPNMALFATATLIFWLPAAGVVGLLLMFFLGRMSVKNPKGATLAILRFIFAGLLVLASIIGAVFAIPQRAVFPIFRSSFEEVVNSEELSKNKEGELDRRIGIWKVDRYGTDRRGGVYFRMRTVADGPDQISYGFVYQPNTDGTPFGNAQYFTRQLTKDWYNFCASDDY